MFCMGSVISLFTARYLKKNPMWISSMWSNTIIIARRGKYICLQKLFFFVGFVNCEIYVLPVKCQILIFIKQWSWEYAKWLGKNGKRIGIIVLNDKVNILKRKSTFNLLFNSILVHEPRINPYRVATKYTRFCTYKLKRHENWVDSFWILRYF